MPYMNVSESDFLQHLVETTGLSKQSCKRVLGEVNAYYQLTSSEFVRMRHHELKQQGAKNSVIYEQIIKEVAERRFAVSALSERQVRRIVYG